MPLWDVDYVGWLIVSNGRCGRSSEHQAEVPALDAHLRKGHVHLQGCLLHCARPAFTIKAPGRTHICPITLPLYAVLFLVVSPNGLPTPNIFSAFGESSTEGNGFHLFRRVTHCCWVSPMCIGGIPVIKFEFVFLSLICLM